MAYPADSGPVCTEYVQGVQPIAQAENACGTTALAMALNHLGYRVTPKTLDRAIRRMDTFTSIHHLVVGARHFGAYATPRNRSSFEEIKCHLDLGHVLIVLISPERRKFNLNLHYVLIDGYREHENAQKALSVKDPEGGCGYWLEYDFFVQNHWGNLTFFGIATGLDRLIVALSTQDDLPPGRLRGRAALFSQLAAGIHHLANAIGTLGTLGTWVQGIR